MLHKISTFFSWLFLLTVLAVLSHSCANMAAPTGGAYDIDPPVVRRATPAFNSVNVSPSRIEIEFDENIKIEKPNEKVIVTPPQKNMPVIRSAGRRAIVELNDTLLPNTTYTIDFTDAIVDNNEGNPLENFVYSFSTGDRIDTLSIAGKVLNAQDLEPVTGIYVGIHSNHHDTAFTRIPFERISRTDSRGNFTVRGMAPGKYRVFALNDLNRDYKYDNPQENIAFLDSIVIPSTVPAVRQDTIFQDSLTIDTIHTVSYTRFLPDDLVLRSFLSDFQRQYLQKHERPEAHKLNLFFAAPTDKPTFFLINPEVRSNDWYVAERSAKNDTLMLWITDSLIYQQDSLRMQINYLRTDSLNKNYIATDTLNFNMRRTGRDRGNTEKKEEEEEPIRFLGVNTNVQSTFELYNPIRIEFEQPVTAFDSTYVQLLAEVDSLFEAVPFRLESDSLNPRKFTLRPHWEPGGKYKILIDSAVITSHYGLWNNKYEQSFTVKPLDQYGNLEISITGLPEEKPAFVELLDKSDKPFRKSYVKANRARFQDLPPGEIYARIVIDENEDGVWTTGNYEEGRQPEEVFYYPGKFVIRAFSDHSEDWNVHARPVISQKPLEITINKPEEKKRRNPNLEREQQQRQNQQGSPFSGGGSAGTPSNMR
ncbi:Ig-like domain-containing protein [Proteiniphilum acetatigenes]|uniref:Ig-like domain-containing protein n=1 Tax=Proteiniphilum acetatigenes TaxID=294710 RepID=UPI000361A9D3|nr:Ig-like domain-containing protein [Proteiniphilum acetatigenes]SFK53999.1 Ig-like domain-containing protein [Porphyromonadaceae bacterium KH3CP3RA]